MTSGQTPITKKEMVELLTGFRNEVCVRFDAIEQKLNHHDDLLETIASEVNSVQETLHGHEKRFDHHDELLEALATEVNSISLILEPLVPVQHDHEERISRLERGYTRLILKA